MTFAWPFDVSFALTGCEPSGDRSEVHAMGDVAADVAHVVFQQHALDGALDEFWPVLAGELGELTDAPNVAPDDPCIVVGVVLRNVIVACVEEGARLGYALAQTLEASAEGWPAWGAAALEHRRRSACSGDAHTQEQTERLRLLTSRLRAIQHERHQRRKAPPRTPGSEAFPA